MQDPRHLGQRCKLSRLHKMTCLSRKRSQSCRRRDGAGDEGAMKERIWVVAAVEAIGVLGHVAGEILGVDAVMGSEEPGFRVRDEAVNPRQPAIDEVAVLMRNLVVGLDVFEVAQC